MSSQYIFLPVSSGGGGGGSGTVTSVGLTVPSFLSVSGSPITTSGTFAITLTTEAANTVFAGPATGSPATPTFRALVSADLPAGAGSGTVTSVAMTVPSFMAVSGSPVTTAGTLATSFSTQAANLVLASAVSGGVAVPAFRSLVSADIPSLAYISALTGDVTASGSGSVAATLAAIQGTTVTGTTGTGAVAFSDSPAFTTQLTFGNYHLEPSEFNTGNSGTAKTIDWSVASAQFSTLTNNVTYTFTNPVIGGSYVLRINSGSGSFTAAWPGSVLWASASPPTITVTAGKVDLINFYYDGTNFYGSFLQNY